jgi:hypothetical protein
MTREELRIKWEMHIKMFRTSGEKAVPWCEANQVSRKQLYIWMKRFDASATARTTFLPIQVTCDSQPVPLSLESLKPASSETLRIRIGAAVIEVQAGFEPGLLREVVRALEVDSVC